MTGPCRRFDYRRSIPSAPALVPSADAALGGLGNSTVAVLVSLAYLVLLAASMFLAGILVTVSLVIRHSEAAKKETVH